MFQGDLFLAAKCGVFGIRASAQGTVTPAKAGAPRQAAITRKESRIPACAGMTASLLCHMFG